MAEVPLKTPISQDKRLFVAVGTVIALLLARFANVQLDPELLATIALVVVGYIVPSAVKEAQVAKATIAATTATEAIKGEADAAALLREPK